MKVTQGPRDEEKRKNHNLKLDTFTKKKGPQMLFL